MSFFELLNKRVNEINSLLCIGLDPHIDYLKDKTAKGAEIFCKNIIDKTKMFAIAYKPNAAFFEVFGSEGFVALKNIINYIPNSIPIIYDSKRGDISSTANAYAYSAFQYLNAHAITLSPYMGYDSIEPFVGGIKNIKNACFILCKTSNPSAHSIQELITTTTKDTIENNDNNRSYMLYERIALLAMSSEWNKNKNIGLVAGATDIKALNNIRNIIPDEMWLLTPGIGAQGGSLEETLKAGMTMDGKGIIIPISRAISMADDPYKAAKEYNDKINNIRNKLMKEKNTNNNNNYYYNSNKKQKLLINNNHKDKIKILAKEFISFALKSNVLKFGNFKLKSGRESPYFFNAGLFDSGYKLKLLGQYYAKAIYYSNIEFDILFGPAYKGITLAGAISISLYDLYGKDYLISYNRKEIKDHGEGGYLVGASVYNKRILIVDDVITAGTAIEEAMELLKKEKGSVVGVCVSIDRQERANNKNIKQSAISLIKEKYNIPVINIANLDNIIEYITKNTLLKNDEKQKILKYREQYGILNESLQ